MRGSSCARDFRPVFQVFHPESPIMNVREKTVSAESTATVKFGIGQPVRRTEDPILVQGHGRYTDDVSLPSQAYAVIVRSTHAHGVITSIDTEAARAMPGVLGIYTAEDLKDYGTFKVHRRIQEPRRLRDEKAGAPRACRGQGALRRRSRSLA
jgi:CO/xanthine dehydrogenase Mo-binding subunit